jgi:hypothetical protein
MSDEIEELLASMRIPNIEELLKSVTEIDIEELIRTENEITQKFLESLGYAEPTPETPETK